MRKSFYTLIPFLTAATAFVGCTNANDLASGVSGQAKVLVGTASTPMSQKAVGDVQALSNTCPASNTCASDAQISKFEIKLMSVGIHTHADTTQGYGSSIYANPACSAPEYETEVDGKMYKYVGFGSCSDASISTYLDLKSSTVNADLNSQYLPIAPGSYKFGAVTFCQGGAASNNYRVTLSNDGGLPAGLRGQTVNVSIGTCGITTPEMNPVMSVTEGQSVVVSLEYDLTNTVYYRTLGGGESAGTGCAEIDDNGTRYAVCINPPTVGASFSVE